jgi:hypothetical protein
MELSIFSPIKRLLKVTEKENGRRLKKHFSYWTRLKFEVIMIFAIIDID